MENFNDNSKDIGLNEIMLMNFVTPPQWSVICLVKLRTISSDKPFSYCLIDNNDDTEHAIISKTKHP